MLKKARKFDQERLDLSFSTQNLFLSPGKKYEFAFYLLVFLECFSTELARRQLSGFKIDKIEKLGIIPQEKEKVALNILNLPFIGSSTVSFSPSIYISNKGLSNHNFMFLA